jgi:hypothetical protein
MCYLFLTFCVIEFAVAHKFILPVCVYIGLILGAYMGLGEVVGFQTVTIYYNKKPIKL